MSSKHFSRLALALAVAMVLPGVAMGEEVGPSYAGPLLTSITLDGDLTGSNDWGVSAGSWVPSRGWYVIEDTGTADAVGPGVGGQNSDYEAMYTGVHWTSETSATLYVAVVTGMEIEGVSGGYRPGDVFINFGNDTNQWIGNLTSAVTQSQWVNNYLYDNYAQAIQWDLAFGVTEYNPQNPNQLPAYSIQNNNIDFTPVAVNPAVASYVGLPYDADNLNIANRTAYYSNPSAGIANFAYYNDTTTGDHNVYEFAYQITDSTWLGIIAGQGYSVFWTMNCGNDYLHVPTGPVPYAPPVPIPAAAGIGAIGLAMVALLRRKRG